MITIYCEPFPRVLPYRLLIHRAILVPIVVVYQNSPKVL